MKRMSFLVIAAMALVLMMALAAPAQTVNCSGVAAWSPNSVSYAAGALVTYNGSEYKCIQAHTSQAGWDPVDVPALWGLVGACSTGTATPTPTATATVKPTATPTATVKPTATATATVRATATPTATVNPTATPTATVAPTATPTPTTSGSCAAAWVSTTQYCAGAKVSFANVNYTAAFCSQNSEPDKNNGPAGSGQPWVSNGACSAGATPTPTATVKPTATPTATVAKPTPTPTATAPGGGGTTVSCTAAAWNSTTAYSGGAQVQFDGFLWQAKFFQQGTSNTPVVDENGGWEIVGICGQIPGPSASRKSAPYVDVTGGLFNTVTSTSPVPTKFLTLAFVVSQNGCQASWAGTMPIPAPGTTPPLMSQINSYRAAGGDIIISFGGAAGSELALACGSASALQQQYQNVITQYNAKFIDFDLETSSTNDTMRQQAIAALQHANPGLVVSYTVQTEPNGINSLAETVLQDAISAGVSVGNMNVMCMDLGGAFDNGGQMGLDSQLCGWSAEESLHVAFPSLTRAQVAQMTGVTVMIGTNDNEAEIFQLTDIPTLVNTASSNGWGRIAFWSVTRDQDCLNAGFTTVTPSPASGNCSGVSQSTFQYSNGFNVFNP